MCVPVIVCMIVIVCVYLHACARVGVRVCLCEISIVSPAGAGAEWTFDLHFLYALRGSAS